MYSIPSEQSGPQETKIVHAQQDSQVSTKTVGSPRRKYVFFDSDGLETNEFVSFVRETRDRVCITWSNKVQRVSGCVQSMPNDNRSPTVFPVPRDEDDLLLGEGEGEGKCIDLNTPQCTWLCFPWGVSCLSKSSRPFKEPFGWKLVLVKQWRQWTASPHPTSFPESYFGMQSCIQVVDVQRCVTLYSQVTECGSLEDDLSWALTRLLGQAYLQSTKIYMFTPQQAEYMIRLQQSHCRLLQTIINRTVRDQRKQRIADAMQIAETEKAQRLANQWKSMYIESEKRRQDAECKLSDVQLAFQSYQNVTASNARAPRSEISSKAPPVPQSNASVVSRRPASDRGMPMERRAVDDRKENLNVVVAAK